MPKLGLTMTEGLLLEWLVDAGSRVAAGDVLFVVETDKVANEITSTQAGEIAEILVAQGETVPVGTVVGRWCTDADEPQTAAGQTSDAGEAASGHSPATDLHQVEPVQPDVEEARVPVDVPARLRATPLARRLAAEHDVDLHTVPGTGPRGRIKAQDVRMAVATDPSDLAVSCAAEVSGPQGGAASISADAGRSGTRTAAHGRIRTMARRLVQAKQDIPHFYLFVEAEVSQLLVLRQQLIEAGFAPRPTINHFLIAAVAHALLRHPEQNRIWDDDGIIAFDPPDVGVAVTTEQGLMAPVLHGLSGAALDGLAARANALVERARNGRCAADDLHGGAITLSNAGMLGATYMAPIINPPQSAILGVGAVRPVFRPDAQGQPVLCQELGLTLAADHRLHDGASGMRFLKAVVDLLQTPHQLLRTLP
ncbi:dihydrolipoamide acetyltransferase family protein [Castellaniella sp.]|uniref:dihydrolipoamide acetyltransferase family protein n=1 Tax=Castellaniella sp. TaxID=1955812 RepID=UPI00355D4659